MKKILLSFLISIMLISCSTNYERKIYNIYYIKQNGLITNIYGQAINNFSIIQETENTLLLNSIEDIEKVESIDESNFNAEIINNYRCRLLFYNGLSDTTKIKIVTFKIN